MSLVWVLEDSRLLINPNLVLALLYNLLNAACELGLLLVIQDCNVTLAVDTINDRFLSALDVPGEILFLWRSKIVFVSRSVESLAP